LGIEFHIINLVIIFIAATYPLEYGCRIFGDEVRLVILVLGVFTTHEVGSQTVDEQGACKGSWGSKNLACLM